MNLKSPTNLMADRHPCTNCHTASKTANVEINKCINEKLNRTIKKIIDDDEHIHS